MTTLEQSLHKHDLRHLRIVAQLWGVDLRAGERSTAREELSEKLLNSSLITEVIEALHPKTRSALDALIQNQGRIPWASFTRQFGELRKIGAAKRDREKSYLNPLSAAETLFYRALLARAFFDTPSGAIEFAHIPDDLFAIISPPKQDTQNLILGRPARPEERQQIMFANDFILDDLTTFLAALRLGWEDTSPLNTSLRFVRDLGLAAHLITSEGIQKDSVKSHLETDRNNALDQLIQIWQKSETFNELHQVPTIICEGEWVNPILDTRKAIFDFLKEIPRDKWWSLNAFITDIKKEYPDFQRKAGDYDAWFIRSSKDPKGFTYDKVESESLQEKPSSQKDTQTKPFGSQVDLRGFEHWDEVEGALIRYFIVGILFWLGYVDLASTEEDGEIKAFRVRKKVESGKPKGGKIVVASNGKITISRFAKRVARYQISRFCEWEVSKNPDEFRYQITPSSLGRAKEQGLKVSHLLALLKKQANDEIPPSLGKALRRWAVNGTEARVESLVVLRLSKPEDLRALRESKAGRFLGEVLSPTRVVVKDGASSKIMSALIEMGIFMEERKV